MGLCVLQPLFHVMEIAARICFPDEIPEIKHNLTFTFEQMASPSLADLARIAYVGCLVDAPTRKEDKFMIAMANSDEGAVLAAVGKALRRMTDGLSGIGETDEGKG